MTSRSLLWRSRSRHLFVGNLTFFRVYSGVVNSGDTVLNSVKEQARAFWPYRSDARQQARRDQRSTRW
ncbi:hypothetical protein ACLK12_17815 [Escherichia coli]